MSTANWRAKAGQERRRRTANDILEAAEELVIERIENGESLDDLSLRSIAERAGKSATTVSSHFKTVDAICAELVDRMRTKRQPIAPSLEIRARGHSERQVRSSDTRQRWRVELAQIPRTDIDGRRAYYEASVGGDRLRHAIAAGGLAEAYLPASSSTELALNYAEIGLELCKRSRGDVEFLTTGIQCARIAATACRYLVSQLPEEDVKNLARIRDLKRIEAEYASSMRLWVVATMATFHAERADALICKDPSREIAAIRAVCDALTEHHRKGRVIPDDALASVLARLCAVQMVYSTNPAVAQLETDRTVLMRMFAHPARSETRLAAKALFNVVRFTEGGETPPSPTDLLRAARFGVVGQIGVARYLLHLADVKGFVDEAESDRGVRMESGVVRLTNELRLAKELPRRPEDLRAGALNFLNEAVRNSLRLGAAGVLRDQALEQIQQLGAHPSSGEPDNLPDQEIETLLSQMEQVVVSVLVGKQLNKRQIARIVTAINPVHEFLTQPIMDAASPLDNASSESATISL